MNNAVFCQSQSTNQLPIRWKDGTCRRLFEASSIRGCAEHETMSWEIQYDKTYQQYYHHKYYGVFDCRTACLDWANCRMATYKYDNTPKCYLNNEYKPYRGVQYDDSSYEIAVLACCTKAHTKYNTFTILEGNVAQQLCQRIERKTQKTCFAPVYVKHRGKDSRHSDTNYFANVSLEDCISLCNKDYGCVLFNFHNRTCSLKHKLREYYDLEGYDLYVLYCCPEFSDHHCPSCPPISNRNTTCESPKSPVWSITANYKLNGTNLQTHNNVSLFQCPSLCLANPSCMAISFNNVNQQCDLLGSVGEAQSDVDSEYAILKCVQTDHRFSKSTTVMSLPECQRHTCETVLNRRSAGTHVYWVPFADTDSNLYTIEKLNHLNFWGCMFLCNEYHSCLLFTYSEEKNECQLKYKFGSFVSKPNTTLYIMKYYRYKKNTT